MPRVTSHVDEGKSPKRPTPSPYATPIYAFPKRFHRPSCSSIPLIVQATTHTHTQTHPVCAPTAQCRFTVPTRGRHMANRCGDWPPRPRPLPGSPPAQPASNLQSKLAGLSNSTVQACVVVHSTREQSLPLPCSSLFFRLCPFFSFHSHVSAQFRLILACGLPLRFSLSEPSSAGGPVKI